METKSVRRQIDHGCGIERQCLAEDEPAYFRNAERLAQLATFAKTKRKRQSPKWRPWSSS
jgi:hypothetical protein